MQVHPIKPTLKAPGYMLLKLKYVEPVSNFAFKLNLRRYNEEDDDDALMHIDNVCATDPTDRPAGGLATDRHLRLETHLWHAKRYEMCQKWGFALPAAGSCTHLR